MTPIFGVIADGEGRCHLSIDGDLRVSGPFGGFVETTVRDEVVVPVLEEDLVPLLERWPD